MAVIAGFQGVSSAGRLATLGRGGSDTSAVAVAAAINADNVISIPMLTGLHNRPASGAPGRQAGTHRCEEMLEMASLGAKVLQTRSVGWP